MKKPTKAHLKRKTSLLYFEDDTFGEYYIRGGVSWPDQYIGPSGKADFGGFAILAGLDIENKIFRVFEQQGFVVINNILNADNSIKYQGIATWFNRMWSEYFGRRWYWSQDDEVSKKYRLEIIRSLNIDPKPVFPEVPLSKNPESVVWEYIKLGKLKYESGSELERQVQRLKQGEMLPAVHALICCLAGVEKWPWRRE